MTKRICANCGKEKEVAGGKICEREHFICSGCVSGGFFSSSRTTCPICSKTLR